MRSLTACLAGAAFWLPSFAAQSQDIQFHQAAGSQKPSMLFGADTRGLQERIRQALEAETGFRELKSFSIHWSPDTFRCLVVSNEFEWESPSAVCLVKVTAFQVSATALIVKKAQAVEVSVLETLIE